MIAVSDRWTGALVSSRRIRTVVEVWRGGSLVVADLPIAAGTVVRDAGSDIEQGAVVEVADEVLLRSGALSADGSALRIYTGLRYADGKEELLRVFDGPIVSAPRWTGAPVEASQREVRAEGWMRYIMDDRFTEPFAATDANTALEWVEALLVAAVPGGPVTVAAGVTDVSVTDELVWEQDRIEAVTALAAAAGCVVRDTPDGGFLIGPPLQADSGATPLRSYIYGSAGAMLVGSSPAAARGDRYNGVLAYNPEDPAVRYLATVSDSGSPVVWGGPFGKRVQYFSSPLLTASTVQAAAETRLAAVDGRMQRTELEILPDPSLEPGDHVEVGWKGAAAETCMVTRVEHPLVPGAARVVVQGVTE